MKKITKIIISLCCILQLSACANTTTTAPLAFGVTPAATLLATDNTFMKGYENFSLSQKDINTIKLWPSELRVEVFFGTWCHDSQREVPKLLKILTNNNNIETKLIALDYQKSDPNGLSKSKGIKYTPTFIFYKNNQEIGRIIERPTSSLVADITYFLNREID